MKIRFKPGQRLAFSKSQRELKKKIEKAIRQHKKRSHLRKQLEDEWFSFWCPIFGSGRIGTLMSYTMHKRRRMFKAAVLNNSPLLNKFRELKGMGFATGGKVIGKRDE